MKFQRLLQVLLLLKPKVMPPIVRRSSQRVELVEVGMVGEFHREVRVREHVMIECSTKRLIFYRTLVPNDLSNAPNDLSNIPNDLSNIPNDLSNVPNELRSDY